MDLTYRRRVQRFSQSLGDNNTGSGQDKRSTTYLDNTPTVYFPG
jgi:hypothetical protein